MSNMAKRITVNEAAEMVGLSRYLLLVQVALRGIRLEQYGGRFVFRAADIERLRASMANKQNGPKADWPLSIAKSREVRP